MTTNTAHGATSPGSEPQMLAAQAVSGLSYADLPSDIVAMAKNCILDTIAVAIAGAAEDTVTLLHQALQPGPGPATILGTPATADPVSAATLNGTAAHALDFDDLSKSAMGGHPSAPLLPAVLAAAQASAASGRQLIEAFVAGYELEARLGLALGTGHYDRGFHSTATLGTFGAAAGAARLLALDARATAVALSLAAAQSAGLKAMFGTMAKPLQVGRAAGAGLLAARLADAGYSAPGNVIDGEGSYPRLYTDRIEPAPLTEPFPTRWHLRDNLFKEHASCFGTHAAIDGLTALRSSLGPLDQIAEIELRIPPGHLTVCAQEKPRTGLQGKFSLAYTAAAALLRTDCGPAQFTDEAINSTDIQDLAARVRLEPDPTVPELGTTVTVTLRDGVRRTVAVDSIADGTSRSPQEHWHRITRKAKNILGPRRADQLITVVAHIEDTESMENIASFAC